MNWRLKGAIQKVLGVVPAGDQLHYMLQRRAGGLRNFARELEIKIEDWTLMVGHLGGAGVPVAGTRFVEMGTGWYPTFPFSLYLGGAASVDSFDLNRHLKPELTLECAIRLERHATVIAEHAKRPADEVFRIQQALVRALQAGASLEEATAGVVRYHAPGDASATRLADGSVDVVFSNSVLEHVPGAVIAHCFGEARRILRPGGVAFHSVNCGDHYAYVDDRINQLNYLRYSDDDWELWNNKFLYQNRLRACDFTQLAREAGFTVVLDTSRPHPGRLAELAAIPVHPRFAHYSRDQLAITSIDFIARR